MQNNQNILKNHFPTIRSRGEILSDIQSNIRCKNIFDSWSKNEQELFLSICTGTRGLNITYDPFFKEIMNPEYNLERLSNLLSELLEMKVKVLKVLPNDGIRIANESTLLITDVVVELENGSIVNVEIQKIGYKFPGERASCYSADLLLRQYKRLRDETKKHFKYSDVKPVYTIILFEKSPKEFHKFPNEYLHFVEGKSNTGITINTLQKYLFIPLDIFKKIHQNKPISNNKDAWLTFLSADSPEVIEQLILEYPYFKPLYEDIYEMCRNTEAIMGLFSKELQILDDNTVQFMIDEMQEEINVLRDEVSEKDDAIAEKDKAIAEKDKAIAEKNKAISEKDNTIAKNMILIENLKNKLREYESI